jgi:uncharacterized protein YaaN involved in tellurite resistance
MTEPTQAFEAANQATERASHQIREFGEQATERTSHQIREFGEQAAATSRNFSNMALDTYERAVASYVEFEQKAAEAAPVDWVKAAIDAHASFVKDVNDAYVKAVRGALV